MRAVLRYHGGKNQMADWIVGQMPAHKIYVEPFGGGGSVLLRKPRCYSEIYNDVWAEVVNLFRILRDRDQAAELEWLVRLTPYARVEFLAAYNPTIDPMESARRLLIRSFMGFGSGGANPGRLTGFRRGTKESGTVPGTDWRTWPEAMAEFTTRLQGVSIESCHALEIIRLHDGSETLIYCDPPYMQHTRSATFGHSFNQYAHDLSEADHVALLDLLNGCTGKVMLSGYRCDLYDASLTGWLRMDRTTFADGARKRTEALWLNAAAAASQGRLELGGEDEAL